MNYFNRALTLNEETKAHRHYLHEHAEIGMNLPLTSSYIETCLRELGYSCRKVCGSGIIAEVGCPGKTVLLRAEVDALPMADESGLPFACPNGITGHTCGHDLHGAALLTAAKMLKENESTLNGTIRMMFQPGEETFQGAKAMIQAGVLSNPIPSMAYTGHVTARYPVGTVAMRPGATMASCYSFQIIITGKTSHGACPEEGVDPINIGAHICIAMQEILARETAFSDKVTLTFGTFHAGNSPSTIPNTAELQGTLRTFDNELRCKLIQRVHEIAENVATTYRGKVDIIVNADVPVEYNSPTLYKEISNSIQSVFPITLVKEEQMTGSDDFAFISEKIPCINAFIGARPPEHTGFYYPAHHPKVFFDDRALPYAAAMYAHVATHWLQKHGV